MAAIPDEARALLQRKAYGHVVTRNKNGTPQVSMVWMDVDGDEVLFNTADGRLKVNNLRRDPHVIISVQDTENTQQYLLVHATATITADGADEQIDRLAKKYLDLDSYPWRQSDEPRLIVRCAVERIGGAGPWAGGP